MAEVLINSSLSEQRSTAALSRLPLTRIHFGFFCSLVLGYNLFIYVLFITIFVFCHLFVPLLFWPLLKTTLAEEGNRKYPHIWCCFGASTRRSGFMGSKRVPPPPSLVPSRHQSAFSQLFLSVSASGTAGSHCLLPLPQHGTAEGGKWFTLIRRTKIDKVKAHYQ